MNSPHWNKETDKKIKLSERIADYVIGGYLKNKYRIWMLTKEFKESKLDLKHLCRVCLEHISPVTSPLALISQIQRSGGSLLSQLFDGHPEIHAHPHEMMIGYTKKYVWPRIDLSEPPERWFGVLFEDMVIEHAAAGYKKGRKDNETFPFIFLPSLQKKIFLNYLDSAQSITLRDVFDAYMTSYFSAWLNNQNYLGQKKFITAFTPRLAMLKENMEFFFEVYPDGRLISLIRDPKNWFPSALRHVPKKYGDVSRAMSQWRESSQAMLRNRERYGDRVCLVKFEDLVSKTEPVMRHLAEFLNIVFDDILLVPTFNTLPIKAHTSFTVENHGILNSTLSRYKTLTDEELDAIERMTGETYELVLNEVARFE